MYWNLLTAEEELYPNIDAHESKALQYGHTDVGK